MRKIIVSNLISVDGFISGVNDDISWFVNIADKEFEKYGVNLINSIDTMLFGRITYQLMESYWPNASPDTNDQRIIDAMNNFHKIVSSRTLNKTEWKNTTLIKENITVEIAKLKEQPGKDMVIYGSGSVVSLFAREGLIDNYLIFVYPVAIGKGKTMFSGIKENLKLKIADTRTFSSGVVLIDYRKE